LQDRRSRWPVISFREGVTGIAAQVSEPFL